MRLIRAAVVLVVAACSPTPTSTPSSSPITQPTAAATPSPSSDPTHSPPPTLVPTVAAIEPCKASQIGLSPGHMGAAAGTAYMEISVDLFQGPPCSIPRGPRVTVVTAGGTEVQAASDADPTPIVLRGLLGYELGWNVGCDQSVPPGALSVRIEFSDQADLTMPLGDFGPSCVDGSTGALFMQIDAP